MPEERVSAQDDHGGARVKARGPGDERDRGKATARHEKLGGRAAEQELDSDDDEARGRRRPSADDGHGDEPGSGRETSAGGAARRGRAEGDERAVRRGARRGRDARGGDDEAGEG